MCRSVQRKYAPEAPHKRSDAGACLSLKVLSGRGKSPAKRSGDVSCQGMDCVAGDQGLIMLCQECTASGHGALGDSVFRNDIAEPVECRRIFFTLCQEQQKPVGASVGKLVFIQGTVTVIVVCNDCGYIHYLPERIHPENPCASFALRVGGGRRSVCVRVFLLRLYLAE